MAWENNYSREAPFSSSPYSRALSSAIGRKTSFISIIDKQLEIKRKNHTPRKGWFHSLLSVSTSTLLTETREGLVDHGKGCNFGWNEIFHGLSAGKNLWSFICWCPVLVSWPGAHSHCHFWGHSASDTAPALPLVTSSLRGNEVTRVPGTTSGKLSMRQQGQKTIPDKGWMRKSEKLCISPAVATMCGLGGLIWCWCHLLLQVGWGGSWLHLALRVLTG